ncbi:MAG: hypothetical protein SF097_10955 [Acidobacteriota bacterium]|nr:hypothetical protein [Acidobacteriota bacterium]
MSVKFEIADWKFEITLKELVCQPVGKKSRKVSRDFAADRKEPKKIMARNKEKLHELDYAARR